jgi:hypothetical protein
LNTTATGTAKARVERRLRRGIGFPKPSKALKTEALDEEEVWDGGFTTLIVVEALADA